MQQLRTIGGIVKRCSASSEGSQTLSYHPFQFSRTQRGHSLGVFV